jgi:hypothetical protein
MKTKQLGVTISSLKFFEGDIPAPKEELRVFGDCFKQSTTRYIYFQLNLEYPAPQKNLSFSLNYICYRSDGSIVENQKFDTGIESNWTNSSHWAAWGKKEPGYWICDSYKVEIYINGVNVAHGNFRIVSDECADSVEIANVKIKPAKFTIPFEIKESYSNCHVCEKTKKVDSLTSYIYYAGEEVGRTASSTPGYEKVSYRNFSKHNYYVCRLCRFKYVLLPSLIWLIPAGTIIPYILYLVNLKNQVFENIITCVVVNLVILGVVVAIQKKIHEYTVDGRLKYAAEHTHWKSKAFNENEYKRLMVE